MARSRKWCFTLNNYSESEINKLETFASTIQYLIYGKEIGESGTPHLQGFIYKKNPTTFKAIKKKIGIERIHLESANGNVLQNYKYCSKDGDFKEIGEMPEPGKRKDLNDIKEACRDIRDYDKVILHFDSNDQTLNLQQLKVAERYCQLFLTEYNKKELEEEYNDVELRGWQKEVIKRLDEQSNRKVLWVVDEIGNNGKTYLSKYLVSKRNSFLVRNGKTSDIAYSFNYEDIIIFDFVRSVEGRVNYGVIEAFKDGCLFSPKYESKTKIFKSRKVIVFANFHPVEEMLSSDRWDIITIESLLND